MKVNTDTRAVVGLIQDPLPRRPNETFAAMLDADRLKTQVEATRRSALGGVLN